MPKSTYIALGSNLGRQEENLRLAAAEMQKISTSPLVASSIWWSTPEGFDEAVAVFCNAVVAIEVEMRADELLLRLKEIEQHLLDRGGSGAMDRMGRDAACGAAGRAGVRRPAVRVAAAAGAVPPCVFFAQQKMLHPEMQHPPAHCRFLSNQFFL